MSKFVSVLGARASKEAGAPLRGNFLAQAGKLQPPQEFASLFEEIAALGQLHAKANLDVDIIEFVFATFEMAALIGKMPRDAAGRVSALEALDYSHARTVGSFPVHRCRPAADGGS